MSFAIGAFAFYYMIPHTLIDVDPTLVIKPDLVKILREVILHEGCQVVDVHDESICIVHPEHKQIGENFQERSMRMTDIARAKAPAYAKAMVVSSVMLVIMLNKVCISHIDLSQCNL